MTVVALTGASGFIGSHVAEALLRDGHTVRAVVRDKTNAEKCAHLTALGAAHAAAGGGSISVELRRSLRAQHVYSH